MSDITLSAGVRANLLSLQNTAQLMQTTQNRLATGKKVNSALDNPLNFFTSQNLNSRSSQLSALLDSMSNGIQTIQAANNGLTSITSTVQSMQSTLNQALQDKSFQTASYTVDTSASGTIGTTTAKNLTLTGGAFGTAGSGTISLNTVGVSATAATITGAGGTDFSATDPDMSALTGKTVTLTAGTTTASYTFTSSTTGQLADLQSAMSAAGFTVDNTAAGLDFSRADGTNFTATASDGATGTALGLGGATATSTDGVAGTAGHVNTVDELVSQINGNAAINKQVTASNDNGKLRIENMSTSELDIGGISTLGAADGGANSANIKGNDVRKSLVGQFNTLRDQLDKFADDSSFNGINLLHGDNLKLTLNENGTSALNIQAQDASGAELSINSTNLGIASVTQSDFDSDATINTKLDSLTKALSTLSSLSSSFGSNLSIVQNRQDFTKNMINTLQTGADNLVLADTNEEGANLLALQTRQSLSTTALSLSSQADQAVLQLFG